jgi:glutathione peroxidase
MIDTLATGREFAEFQAGSWQMLIPATFRPGAHHQFDMRKLLFAGVAMTAALFGASNVLDFTLNSIDGKPAPLSQYQGKVVLIVNVASRCGFTPQYTGLEKVYEKYKDQGFVILGFPANNFGGQEPGTNEEIKTFCSSKYNVTFPMYAKISVKGADIHPLYQFLTDKQTNPTTGGDIKWNFTKFLVAKDGKVVARFESAVTPESPEVTSAIEKALH